MSRRKILIVDDEPEITDSLKSILERKGCQVFTAAKSEEAWEIFQKEKPHACTIDINLPFSNYDGVELLKKIKQADKSVICVMLTCIYAAEDKGKLALDLGADAFKEKPLARKELLQLIDLLMG